MKRILLIALLVSASIIAGCISAITLAINFPPVQRLIISRVNRAIPGTLDLHEFHLNFYHMRLKLLGVSLTDASGKKVAGFDRLFIDMALHGLFQRKVVIEDIVLDRPWCFLRTDSTGNFSLLGAFPAKSSSGTEVKENDTGKPFHADVQNLDIRGGYFLLESERDTLRVQSGGITFHGKGTTDSLRAQTALGLDSASLRFPGFSLRLHDFSIKGKTRNGGIDTLELTVRTENSTISLRGSATPPFSDPFVHCSIRADIALDELGRSLSIIGGLQGRSTLRLTARGRVSNPDIDCDIVYGGGSIAGYRVDSLHLSGTVHDRTLTLLPLHVKTDAGGINVTGDIDGSVMFPEGFLSPPATAERLRYDIAVSGNGIPLVRASPGLSGTGSFSLALRGEGVSPDSLSALLRFAARIDSFSTDSSLSALDGEIACRAAVGDGTVEVRDLKARLGVTELSLTGSYGIFSGQADASMDLVVPALDTLLAFAGIHGLTGNTKVTARVKGSPRRPSGRLDLAGSVAAGSTRVGNLALAVELDPDGTMLLDRLELVNGESRLSAHGSALVLDQGVPVPPEKMKFDISLRSPGLSIGDFIDSMAGNVRLDATLAGTVENAEGELRVSVLDAAAAGFHIPEAGLEARIYGQRIFVEPLRVILSPGQEITASGWAALRDSFMVALSASDIRLGNIPGFPEIDSLEGLISLDIKGQGTYGWPKAEGTCRLTGIRRGILPFDDMGINVDLTGRKITIDGSAIGMVRGSFDLESKEFNAGLSCAGLSLAPYLALTGQNLEGILTAQIEASGDADSLEGTRGNLSITDMVLDFNDKRIIRVRELNASLANGRYDIPEFNILFANEGTLTGNANGNLDGPHRAVLEGTVPLSVTRYFMPDFSDIDGTVGIDAFFNGTAEKSDLRANIQLNDVGMTIPGTSQRLHSLSGRILANPAAVRIETLGGNIDEGALSVRGGLSLDNLTPSDMDIRITLQNLPVEMPGMLDLVLDADLRATGKPDTSRVEGDIVLLDGVYYRDVSINPLSGMGKRKRREPPPPADDRRPYLKNMRFDVGVQARSPFRVDNNLARLTITPDLHLAGTLTSPTLGGRADVEEGTVTYLRREFTVERGVIDFVNPYTIEPEIDIKGSVQVQSRLIRIAISGSPDDLAFALTCDGSDLEDQDIISLLVLGKTSGELQSELRNIADGASTQQMLTALMASTLGEGLRKATGLDMLEIETGKDNDTSSNRIAVTIGKQITRRLGTTYTIESKDGETVQRAAAEYRILQNLKVEGFQEYYLTKTDDKGAYGGQIRFTWERR